MKLGDVKKVIPAITKANGVPLLVGCAGIGKTAIVSQYAKENGYHFVPINIGTQDVGDLIGLPTDQDGKTTKFLPPDWVWEAIEYAQNNPNSKAVLFFDELNRARREVLQAIFPLLLEKRIHTLQFPENVEIIAAMNPETSDYVVTDLTDKALIDRFCFIKVDFDEDEWFKYAQKKNFNPALIAVLKEQPGLFQGKQEEFDLDFIEPSPRSHDFLNDVLKTPLENDLLFEVMKGFLGTVAAAAMMDGINNAERPLLANDILNGFSKENRDKIKKQAKGKSSRCDLIKYTTQNILSVMEEMNTLDNDQLSNLEEFVNIIPKDLMFDFCRKVYLNATKEIRDVFDGSKVISSVISESKSLMD